MIAVLACAVLCLPGCVHRQLHIRSEPPGAPVWVDEEYVGTTPVEIRFTHYGGRRVRVGPIREIEDGSTLYRSSEALVRLKAPWYQKFPLDFFFEVLWPATINDIHNYHVSLIASETLEDDEKIIRDTLEEARQFRDSADRPPDDF